MCKDQRAACWYIESLLGKLERRPKLLSNLMLVYIAFSHCVDDRLRPLCSRKGLQWHLVV